MKCFLCGNKAKKKHFCYGCRVLICDDCDDPNGNLPPGGKGHNPASHLRCGSCNVLREVKNPPGWITQILS